MIEPSENIYTSFQLFMNAAKSRNIVEMSAGVNWSEAPDSVVKSLEFELSNKLSYRNYGRSVGGKFVTDIIERCERIGSGSHQRVRCAITNGASDGAHSLVSSLLSEGHLQKISSVAMVGVAFPVYSSLINRLGLHYCEVVGSDNLIPSLDYLFSRFVNISPDLIIIALPHNPTGIVCSPEYYVTILEWAKSNGVKVIVDRVCLMPWDDVSQLKTKIYPFVADGTCFLIDSPSKSLSLAGIRIGYVLMAKKYFSGIESELRARSLNPIVFGSLTLALCQLATVPSSKLVGQIKLVSRAVRKHHNILYSQYPSDFIQPSLDVSAFITKFVTDYNNEISLIKSRFALNLASVHEFFEGHTSIPIILDAGLNLVLQTPSMKAENEKADQEKLALDYGVCILTRRCFQSESAQDDRYYIRLSLSIPSEGFRRGIICLYEYFVGSRR
jgi:aspartate/methionine/tyrosine aminotransferase